MGDGLAEAVDAAARLICDSHHVVALVGAGLSVESGIPPFRGPGGIWTRLGRPSAQGYQRFLDDSAAWWRERLRSERDGKRSEFSDALERAEPNAAHYALVELERLGALDLTITQNIDNLHRKAGSRRVAEIHGNRTMLRCIVCESRWRRDEFAIETCPPLCPVCGGLVKSDTVMFGEPIPPRLLAACSEAADRCDCMLAAGTSASVYPAARFPKRAVARGCRIIEANSNPTSLSGHCDVVLRGPAAHTLPRVVQRVKEFSGL